APARAARGMCGARPANRDHGRGLRPHPLAVAPGELALASGDRATRNIDDGQVAACRYRQPKMARSFSLVGPGRVLVEVVDVDEIVAPGQSSPPGGFLVGFAARVRRV